MHVVDFSQVSFARLVHSNPKLLNVNKPEIKTNKRHKVSKHPPPEHEVFALIKSSSFTLD
jgi:hypothetical protein